METLVIAIAGLCFGVLLARVRIPRFEPLPMICTLVLVAIGIVGMTPWAGGLLVNGLTFVVAAAGATCLYGAELWKKNGLGEPFSFWQLVWMSAIRPGYLQAVHDQATDEESELAPLK